MIKGQSIFAVLTGEPVMYNADEIPSDNKGKVLFFTVKHGKATLRDLKHDLREV